jgi:hypothetical protein
MKFSLFGKKSKCLKCGKKFKNETELADMKKQHIPIQPRFRFSCYVAKHNVSQIISGPKSFHFISAAGRSPAQLIFPVESPAVLLLYRTK